MHPSKITYLPNHRADMVKAPTLHSNLFLEHKMIWNLMPQDADARRNFLYRRDVDKNNGFPFYSLLSEREPEQTHEFLQVQSRGFSPQLVEGGHYGFSLRANAVITRKADDTSKKRIRRDIVDAKVDEYKQRFSAAKDHPPSAVIHHEAGKQWLSAQGEKQGFKLLNLMVSNHQFHQHSNNKNDHHKRQFASLDFDGTLEITDPKKFVKTMYTGQANRDPNIDVLARGLGRSKAFGCGLLLIRKA